MIVLTGRDGLLEENNHFWGGEELLDSLPSVPKGHAGVFMF
jgi:hypothetical protein